jgi:hypothetical protein
MQRPTYKWIPFLLIAIFIYIIVEFMLNWPLDNVFAHNKGTYVIDSIVFIILLMLASLIIWFFNRLYFKKADHRSFWNVLYNILSFVLLFYVCFFVKISVISRLISPVSLNKIFNMWHLRTADTGAYQTVSIFIVIQILFLIYLAFKADNRVVD